MSESIRRNDPCPCGSGKKYKKCCMNKQQVVQLKEVKEERFLQQKNQLTSKLRSFIHDKVSAGETYQLEATFNKRSGRVLQQHKPYAHFWMYFFHRYENGLRGIEWFVKEQGHRLDQDEREMAERWMQLKPQLVQAVENQEDNVIFEDIVTKDTYAAPKSEEHISYVKPWYGALGLLEPKDDVYYFNGMRVMVGPHGLRNAKLKAEEIQESTGLTLDEVLVDYYPEVFSALHRSIEDNVPEGDLYEAKEYKYFFSVEDQERAAAFFVNDHSFQIDEWTESSKELTWTGNWKAYEDNEMNGEILIADVYAALSIQNGTLTVQTYGIENMNAIFKKLMEARGVFIYQDEKVTSIGNLPIQIKPKTVRIQEGIPSYFALYAQNEELLNVDAQIPKYHYKSLRELVNEGHEQVADDWLKQNEYMVYGNVVQQFGEVDVTADFNKPRKELGLSLSAFVTGGADRVTEFRSVDSPIEREAYVMEEEIPEYEDLGITNETKNLFFVQDLLRFYREKVDGKSEGTKRKYRDSLAVIRELLEVSEIQSWDECQFNFWKFALVEGFFEEAGYASLTYAKDFISVVKAFTKWLDKEKGMNIGKDVAAFLKEKESSILNAVRMMNAIMDSPEYPGLLHEFGAQIEYDMDLFLVEEINKDSLVLLNSEDQHRTLSIPEGAVQFAEVGMMIQAEIGKAHSEWDIINLDEVFPAE